jgi:hypothetical protein
MIYFLTTLQVLSALGCFLNAGKAETTGYRFFHLALTGSWIAATFWLWGSR